MSPSEDKALTLGLRLLHFERHSRTTMLDGKSVRTRVYARFESPPIASTTANTISLRKHVLHSYAKSRAGAWRHAIRWLRQLQNGKLS